MKKLKRLLFGICLVWAVAGILYLVNLLANYVVTILPPVVMVSILVTLTGTLVGLALSTEK